MFVYLADVDKEHAQLCLLGDPLDQLVESVHNHWQPDLEPIDADILVILSCILHFVLSFDIE